MPATARTNTNFHSDIEVYGKIGEEWFKNILTTSKKTINLIDCSICDDRLGVKEMEELRRFDIDILQYTKEDAPLPRYIIDKYYTNRKIIPDNAGVTAYEIKTDTQIGRTRNIFYEEMSHTNPGCMARTLSNYIVYAGIDFNKSINEAYLIKTLDLRRYVLDNFNTVKRCRMDHRGSGSSDVTAGYLINIEELMTKKIATKIL